LAGATLVIVPLAIFQMAPGLSQSVLEAAYRLPAESTAMAATSYSGTPAAGRLVPVAPQHAPLPAMVVMMPPEILRTESLSTKAGPAGV
jgi:hypothetical protein